MARALWISCLAHVAALLAAGSRETVQRVGLAGRAKIEVEIVRVIVDPAGEPSPSSSPSPFPSPVPATSSAASSPSRFPVSRNGPARSSTSNSRQANDSTAPSAAIGTRAPPGSLPAESAPDKPTSAAGSSKNPLAMRGIRHDLALGEQHANPIAVPDLLPSLAQTIDRPPQHGADRETEMKSVGGGRSTVRDAVATFNVAPDGTVDISHAPDFTMRLNVPTPGMLANQWRWLKKDLDRWAADPYRDTRVGRTQDLPNHLRAVPGACDSWGAPGCFTADDQKKEWELEDEGLASGGSVARGRVDLTGYLHRKHVGDPYASRKLKILDQTRDERARIGAEFREAQLDRSSELVQRNLEALWRGTTDAASRRAALFAIWDECDESGERGVAGDRARAMVIGWIRTRLPPDSPDAYTAAEVARLDAIRTSRQHFAPYAP